MIWFGLRGWLSLIRRQDFIVSELMVVLGAAFIKISFGLTLLRTIRTRQHVYSTYVVIAAASLMGSASFFVVLFTCKPVQDFWTMAEDSASGHVMTFTGRSPDHACMEPSICS